MDQKQIQDKLERIQREVNQVIRGKENVVERVLAAIISGGHILMEDIPGVGKTTLATTFAKALSMNYKRVQFTPDVFWDFRCMTRGAGSLYTAPVPCFVICFWQMRSIEPLPKHSLLCLRLWRRIMQR